MKQDRLNIYLDDPRLRDQVRIAAARAGETLSQYCAGAIRARLAADGVGPPTRESARAAADRLDRARKRIGPLGTPVRALIEEGRKA